MSPKPETPAADQQPEITQAFIAADHPDIANAFRAEGGEAAVEKAVDAGSVVNTKEVAEGLAEAVTAERERILGIQGHTLPGHEDLVAKLVADGKTTPDAAASQILAAEKQTGARQLAQAQADEADTPKAEAGIETGVAQSGEDESVPIEDRAKAKWDASADIRSEFKDFSTYLAFRQVEEANKTKEN